MVAERHDAVLRQLELFRALAEEHEREQQLGSFTVYAYHSLGEWLATAVQLAGSVSWQAHYALRPLLVQGDHERVIAGQGRGMIELYGAVLVGALGACGAARGGRQRPVARGPSRAIVIAHVQSGCRVAGEV